MTRLRLLRWSGSVLSPRTRPGAIRCIQQHHPRLLSAAAIQQQPDGEDAKDRVPDVLSEEARLALPSPPVQAARNSAKLAALHSRLSLPAKLPLETLARTLVDSTADRSPRFNNGSFSILGRDLLNYYTSEYLICQYPRLPLAVIFAAMYAYVGPKALATITREWGVEIAAAPGGEVDPGMLQLKRRPPQPQPEQSGPQRITTRPDGPTGFRHTISSRTVYDDEFGERKPQPQTGELYNGDPEGVTVETGCRNFVRALMGAVYLHGGRVEAKQFYRQHFMSRQLNMANLFEFRYPTRDLSRLCTREGYRSPVARILSETGRKSRHPVFVVGVFSGNDKLGEGAGSTLDEARTRAAVAALKGWYLYSPLDFRLPSETEEAGHKPWVPVHVDSGDIVV